MDEIGELVGAERSWGAVLSFGEQLLDCWRRAAFVIVLCHAWLAMWQSGRAAEPTAGARSEAARWTAAKFGGIAESRQQTPSGRPPFTTDPPFSFKCDGKSSRDLRWQGMTENLYVQGHLAFWDELRRRHPGLRIDSCASGGRRNDLETMRRAVPLLRSDFQFPNMPGVVEGNQGHTYGLSFWLPFQGTGCYLYEPYAYRSFYLPSFGMGALTAENTPAQQRAYAECRQIAPLMLADYYPLTPYSRKSNQWTAWQFNRPEQGTGMVQAFRRPQSADEMARFRLHGLDPGADYVLTNLDSGESQTLAGRPLLDKGLAVSIAARPGSAVIVYKKEK